MPEQLILGPKFDAILSGIQYPVSSGTGTGASSGASSIQTRDQSKKNKNVAPSSVTKTHYYAHDIIHTYISYYLYIKIYFHKKNNFIYSIQFTTGLTVYSVPSCTH